MAIIKKINVTKNLFFYKLSKVNPVYKSDDIKNVNNYRLISVLSFSSKIIEKVVYNRTMDFFLPNTTYQ